MKKKIIAVLLSACMLVSACPTGAFAMSDEETNTYTATGDVMQGGAPVVDETPVPEETAAPEETPTPAPEETPTPAPAETPAPVEVEAQATPAAGTEEAAPAKQSAETGIAMTMLLPDDKKPTVDTYRFYDADGKELTEWQQTVAKGEELLEPTAPTKENARFVGWYVGETPLSFGAVESVSGTEVTVTAKFEAYSYVYFLDEDGDTVVYHTAAGTAGETVGEDILNAATAKVELTMSKDKGVVGWSTTQGSDTPETITFAAGVTYVYPVVKTGFWVTFNTDGGDYVAPQFRMEALDLNTITPNRSGYTFDGWYIDGQKVTSVSAEATVTAHWKVKSETKYTVIHWQENADDNEYSSKDIEKKTGATNSTTNAKAKSYSGFTAQAIEQKTIAGDGSTIVNVYYKRNVYDVKFYTYRYYYGWDENTSLRITAKYGAVIRDKWPNKPESAWNVSKNGSTWQAGIDVMPLNGATFYERRKSGYNTMVASYYLETISGGKYELDHQDTVYGNDDTVTKEDRYSITGFTLNESKSTRIGRKYDGAKFYYDRESYNIVFMNKGAEDSKVSRKYQQDISNANYTPKKPAGVPANFTFAGWYDNELCEGTAYDFTGKTMPAQNITLYAKWQAPVIEATVYLTASADGAFEKIEIPYGTKLSDSEKFKALLENFTEEQPSAWIDSNGALFNVDTELYSSVTISPFFPSAKDGFTVTYVEDKNENVATDNQKYVSGSSALVLPPENSENFRAWETEGKLIHPGDKITVTKNTTLTAVYTNKPQTETITYHYNFTDKDGNYNDATFKDGNHPKNTNATVKSLSDVGFEAPTGYEFLGWATAPNGNVEYQPNTKVFVDATGDNNLYAVWQVKTYTVTWVNWDGTVLETDTDVEYNSDPSYDGKNPTRAADAQYTYTFKGWTPEVSKVTGNAVYTAVYEKTTNKYTVTWKNDDGSVLRTDKNVEYGTMPNYGANPTKAADAQYTYTFKGWTPEVSKVTGNAVYTAVYEKTTNKYTVTWKNDDGSVLRTDKNVEYGTMPNYGANPTKAADAQYTYTFKGWTPEVSKVTGNAVYTAVYDKAVNKYTIKWVDWDGSEVRTDTEVPYGTELEVPENPTRAADDQYTYTFKDWTPEVKTVTGDAVYTAVYDKTVNKYTVTWKNDDGSVLRTDKNVEYGTMPNYGANPTKAADAQYTYTFKGWTPEVSKVTGNAVYTAVYEKTTNKYTVTWKNDDGSVLRTDKNVEYGTMPNYGANPTKAADAQYTYTFKGWTPEVKTVTGDATYQATYTKEANTYTLTYDLDGGEWENDTTYTYPKKYNEEVEVKADPTKEGYTFAGWMSAEIEVVNGKFTMPAKNVTLKAKWEANTYKVTYDLDGGEWTETTNEFPYKYKATVEVIKTVPTREGYKFSGWRSEEVTIENDAFTMPAKNVTLKAKWEANIYTVTYDLNGGEWTETTNEFPYEYKATVEIIKTVPTREGYKFSGWRSEEVTIENDAFTMPAKDVVLKAVWEAKPTPTPIPSEEPTPTPAPTEEPTPTPAPTEEPTPTPAPTEEPTPTPAPTEEPTPTPAPTEESTPTPAPTEESTPTPAPNPNPATPTPYPVAPVVPATVATPTPKPTATPSATPSDNGGKGDGNNDGEIGETINDNDTPLANGEDIADNATPLAGLGTGAWALFNLILTIVTTLLSILLLIGYIGKKKKALEDEDGNVVLDENGKEVMEYEKNKKGLWRLISIIPALIAIIVFIFTEDMTLPMIFVDKWTILHVVIALVQVVVMVLCKKKKDENDEDENAANA